MNKFLGLTVIFITSVLALEINIPNPPPEDVERDWVMVPDENGTMYMVNVEEALNEVFPRFSVESGVVFELYTRSNPVEPQELRINDLEALAASNFNAAHPTRFVVHGFRSRGSLTDSFLHAYFGESDRETNFFAVNWQAGSSTLNYVRARNRVNPVGAFVGSFIDYLVHQGNLNLEDVVLIGHSLGAHIVGIAGKHTSSGQLPKIIGLDPANPLFYYRNTAERIASTDARSVEIIHSAAGSLGFSSPLGTASFYPNGGRSQPGCGIDAAGSCAHSRAHEFYLESINTDVGFYSWECSSYNDVRRGRCRVINENTLVRMGGDPGNQGKANGIYFLETNRRAPFAMGRP